LGWLLLAPLLLDLLWPLFIAAGLESVQIVPGITVVTPLDLHDYPYTHSLVTSLFWSVLLGGGYLLWRHDRRGGLVLGIGVFSHWILDFVTHRPDMPLYPGSTTFVGLGLWNSLAGTLVVGVAMFVAGVIVYARVTRARDRVGGIGFAAFMALLALMYVGALFGPPPPSVRALTIAGLISWVVIPLAWWIDAHRGSRTVTTA